jgi:hypothetical protein
MSAAPVALTSPAPAPPRAARTRLRSALAKLRHPSRRLALGILLVLTLAAAPRLVELALPRIVSAVALDELGLHVVIGRVDLDLATMTLRVREISARAVEGGPLIASIPDATIVLAPRRILEGVVIERIEVDHAFAAGRVRNGQLDWVEAIAAARSRKPDTPPSDVPPFLIETIELGDVHVALDDGQRHHELDLAATAYGVGTSGSRPGRAFVRGSGPALRHLAVAGELDLRAAFQSIAAEVLVSGLDAEVVADLVPGIAASGRELDFTGRASVMIERDPPSALRVTLRFEDATLAADGRADLHVGRSETVLGVEPGKPTIWHTARLADASVALERDALGALRGLGFVVAPPEGGPPSSAAPLLPDIPFDVATVSRCSVRLRDRLAPGEPEVRLDDIHAEVHAPRWMQGRTIGARFAANAPGLASHLEVVANGSHVASAYELNASVVAEDLDPTLLDAYLAAAGRRFGSRSHFEASLEAVAEEIKDRGVRARARLVEAELRGDHGARARASDVQLALDWTADRVEVESLVGNVWTTITRASDGTVAVAGFPPAPPDPKRPVPWTHAAHEPGTEVRLRDLALGIGIHYTDELRATGTDAILEARAGRLVLGPHPERGTFSLRGTAPGLARSIDVSGRFFPSAVRPSADLTLAMDLEPGILDAYLEPLGWKVLLLDKRLALEASLSRDLADPANRTTSARVTHLVLADARGEGAGVDEVRVELRQTADPALLWVPLVAIRHPRTAVDETSAGLVVARTLVRSRKAPVEPVSAARMRRRTLTTRVQEIRLEDGEANITSASETSASEPPIAVRDLQVRAGPLEIGPGAVRSLVLEVTGSAPGVLRTFAVKGSLARPVDYPTVRLSVSADGIDLEQLRARAAGMIDRVDIHDGSFHAALTGRFAPLREGGFTALVTIGDLSLANDEGREVLGLGELRARIVRFDPATLDLDISSLEIDRPRVEAARTSDARLAIAGVVTEKQFLALSDEERRLKALGLLPPEKGKESRPAHAGRTPRLTLDHASLADADVYFRDSGTLDDAGRPIVFHVVGMDGTVDRFAIGGPAGPPTPLRFETECRFEDGMRSALDGVITLGEDGVGAGRVEGEVRGLSLPRISRYAENAAGVSLSAGYLDGAAGLDLHGNAATGEVEVAAHHLRISRHSDDPLRFVGSTVAMTLLTDWQGDTTVTIPVKDSKVGGGALFAVILRELILSTLGQPFHVLLAIPEHATGETPKDWLRRLLGRTIAAEVEEEALFSPGDARLTLEGARAVAGAALLVKERGGRQVRLRALLGPGDRTRARRAASLAPAEVKDLVARLEAARARQESLRRDLAACQRVALVAGDVDRAADARQRLLAVEAAIAELDHSEGELAERVEYEDTAAIAHTRSEEALRRLAAARIDAVRRALGAAGVNEKLVRVLPARLHEVGDEALVPGGGGRVTLEVAP